ncbi:MAG: hypothetical protein K2J93_04975 [Anaeroplasmataceae bacterium]|nr:hypothetical protein [Anaeroplasmataceae bacterium]
MELIKYLAFPLVLTLLIETIVLVILKERRIKVYVVSIIMNIITNITLNLIGYHLVIKSIWLYDIIVIVLEALIWFLEGIGYYLVLKNKRKAVFYTLTCNVNSFLLGTFLQMIWILIWRG